MADEWLKANHPELAARWSRLKGSEVESDSNESPAPKLSRLPRKPGMARDFGSLSPSDKNRHPYNGPTKESDSMGEQPVLAAPGTRAGEKMSMRDEPESFQLRDRNVAGRARVHK